MENDKNKIDCMYNTNISKFLHFKYTFKQLINGFI